MISKSTILSAMQFSTVHDLNPMNTTAAARATISYQYATSSQPADMPTGSNYSGWTALSTEEKIAFEQGMKHIESFLNVRFVEITGSADPDLNVGKVTLPGSTIGHGGVGLSYNPATSDITGYDSYVVYDNTLNLTKNPHLILHELGHALGLKHSFADPALPANLENNKYTVMSYSNNPDNNQRSDAMMLFDVYALQDTWGAAEYNTGDTTYTGSRTATVDTIWDTGGRDVFNASSRDTNVVLNLKQGMFSSFDTDDDVVIAFGTRIEKAIGGARNDTIIGNWARNVLKGGAGNDKVFGGNSNDRLQGQAGNDTLRGQNGDDTLFGQNGRDTLLGGSGNDTLNGGNGQDKINGQTGDDTLTGNGGADVFQFHSGGGNDTVTDFADNIDTIRFFGLGNTTQVMDMATQLGRDVVFDFGSGDSLTVLHTTVNALSDDILA